MVAQLLPLTLSSVLGPVSVDLDQVAWKIHDALAVIIIQFFSSRPILRPIARSYEEDVANKYRGRQRCKVVVLHVMCMIRYLALVSQLSW